MLKRSFDDPKDLQLLQANVRNDLAVFLPQAFEALWGTRTQLAYFATAFMIVISERPKLGEASRPWGRFSERLNAGYDDVSTVLAAFLSGPFSPFVPVIGENVGFLQDHGVHLGSRRNQLPRLTALAHQDLSESMILFSDAALGLRNTLIPAHRALRRALNCEQVVVEVDAATANLEKISQHIVTLHEMIHFLQQGPMGLFSSKRHRPEHDLYHSDQIAYWKEKRARLLKPEEDHSSAMSLSLLQAGHTTAWAVDE